MLINRTQSSNHVKTGFESTNKVFLPWQSLVTEKDFATGNKKTTELTVDAYGNPLTQKVKFFDSHYATSEKASNLTEYKDYWSAPGMIPSKPQTIIYTVNRFEQSPISITNKITYDSKGNTSSTNELTISMEYDGFGTPIRQTDDLDVWSKTEIKWYKDTTKPNVLFFTESTSNNGLTSAKYFDKLGRALFAAVTDPIGEVSWTKTVYNYKGQVVSVSEPYFEGTSPTQFTSTAYNPYYGFPVSTTLPTGVVIKNTAPTPENPGRTTTVTNIVTGITTSQKADCTGKVISATDPGGTLTYTYYSDGQTKQINSPDGNNVSITYDEYGRQKTLNDPDAGVIEYIHDAFGQLIYQKDANGNEFDMHYDKLGRLLEKETVKNSLTTNQVFKYYPFDAAKGRRGAIDYTHYTDENGNNTRETYLYNEKHN